MTGRGISSVQRSGHACRAAVASRASVSRDRAHPGPARSPRPPASNSSASVTGGGRCVGRLPRSAGPVHRWRSRPGRARAAGRQGEGRMGGEHRRVAGAFDAGCGNPPTGPGCRPDRAAAPSVPRWPAHARSLRGRRSTDIGREPDVRGRERRWSRRSWTRAAIAPMSSAPSSDHARDREGDRHDRVAERVLRRSDAMRRVDQGDERRRRRRDRAFGIGVHRRNDCTAAIARSKPIRLPPWSAPSYTGADDGRRAPCSTRSGTSTPS